MRLPITDKRPTFPFFSDGLDKMRNRHSRSGLLTGNRHHNRRETKKSPEYIFVFFTGPYFLPSLPYPADGSKTRPARAFPNTETETFVDPPMVSSPLFLLAAYFGTVGA